MTENRQLKRERERKKWQLKEKKNADNLKKKTEYTHIKKEDSYKQTEYRSPERTRLQIIENIEILKAAQDSDNSTDTDCG